MIDHICYIYGIFESRWLIDTLSSYAIPCLLVTFWILERISQFNWLNQELLLCICIVIMWSVLIGTLPLPRFMVYLLKEHRCVSYWWFISRWSFDRIVNLSCLGMISYCDAPVDQKLTLIHTIPRIPNFPFLWAFESHHFYHNFWFCFINLEKHKWQE